MCTSEVNTLTLIIGQMSYMKLHAAESSQGADSLEDDDENSEDGK